VSFIVKVSTSVGSKFYGPFKTAALAAKWAPAHLVESAVWEIIPLKTP